MSIAENTIRVGLKYKLVNFGEEIVFIVEEALDEDNFKIKDLETLEEYELIEFTRYGRGKDFELFELDEE